MHDKILSKKGVLMAVFLRASKHLPPLFHHAMQTPKRAFSSTPALTPRSTPGVDIEVLTAHLVDPEKCSPTVFSTVIFALIHLDHPGCAPRSTLEYIAAHPARFESRAYNFLLLESAFDQATEEGDFTLATAEFGKSVDSYAVLQQIRLHCMLSEKVEELFLTIYFPPLSTLTDKPSYLELLFDWDRERFLAEGAALLEDISSARCVEYTKALAFPIDEEAVVDSILRS